MASEGGRPPGGPLGYVAGTKGYCTYCGMEIDLARTDGIYTTGPRGEYYWEDCAEAE